MVKNNSKEIKLIVGGLAIFMLRYIPFYNYKDNSMWGGWYSISSANSACNTMFGSLAKECVIVKPINALLIIVVVALIGYGLYLLFQKGKK